MRFKSFRRFSRKRIAVVHRDLVEELIDGAAQFGDRPHGGFEILMLDRHAGLAHGDGDRRMQRLLLALDEKVRIDIDAIGDGRPSSPRS